MRTIPKADAELVFLEVLHIMAQVPDEQLVHVALEHGSCLGDGPLSIGPDTATAGLRARDKLASYSDGLRARIQATLSCHASRLPHAPAGSTPAGPPLLV